MLSSASFRLNRWYRYSGLLAGAIAVPLLAGAAGPALGRPTSAAVVPALMHLHLLKSEPAADASLAKSPSEIRLIFSARVTIASVNLWNTAGQRIGLGAVRVSVDPKSALGKGQDSIVHNAGIVVAPIPQALKPGAYRVAWKATGTDGHAVKNQLTFTVGTAPAAAAPNKSQAPSSHPSHQHQANHP